MSDDLIKRLGSSCYLAFENGTNDYSAAQEAIDHIEQTEAKLAIAVESIKQSIKLWEKPDGGDRLGKLDNAYDGFELLFKALAELEGK